MIGALKIVAAVVTIVLCGVAVVVLATRPVRPAALRASSQHDRPPVNVIANRKTGCQYVVGAAGDDFHVVASGSADCRSRIVIDGVWLFIDRRALLR